MAAAPRWIPLAEVARPHGVRGELRLKVYNEDSDVLVSAKTVLLKRADGAERTVRLSEVRPTNGALLVRIEGVGSRDEADALRGARICLERSAFPPLEEGEFYACDIEGAQVVGPSGRSGRVVAMQSFGGQDLLVIDTEKGRIEIPLNERFIVRVDPQAGVVELADEVELWEALGW